MRGYGHREKDAASLPRRARLTLRPSTRPEREGAKLNAQPWQLLQRSRQPRPPAEGGDGASRFELGAHRRSVFRFVKARRPDLSPIETCSVAPFPDNARRSAARP